MPNINISISNDIGHKKLSKKKEFIHALLKRIDSSSQILRIKGLIVAHYLIRKTYDSQLIEVLADKLDSFPVQS